MALTDDLALPSKRIALLFEFALDSGTRRFWTSNRSLFVDGQEFFGIANLTLQLAIRQSLSLGDLSASFRFRGGLNEIFQIALNENYQNRPAYAWLAALNEDGTFRSRGLIVVGRLINISIETSAEAVLTEVEIEGAPAFVRDTTVINYTSSDQQAFFPTDTIFDYIEASRTDPPRWGA